MKPTGNIEIKEIEIRYNKIQNTKYKMQEIQNVKNTN